MEPIKDPVPGNYYGYQCRCGELMLLMPEPEKAADPPFRGTEPIPVTCPSCGQKSAEPSISWKRFEIS